jgi:trimeric autotransporter adhesin
VTLAVLAASAASVVVVGTAPASAASGLSLQADPSYQTNGEVDAVLPVGDTVYLGGAFTSVRPFGAAAGSGEVARPHLAAFDLTTGALLPWNPGTDKQVLALAASPDGSTVYVGGAFAKVGGLARGRLAAVDAASGAVDAWAPKADLKVLALAVTGSEVYLGGTFDTVDGQPRSRLAAVDPVTGALDLAWAPSADDKVRVIAEAPDGQSLFVGGNFGSISGDTTQKILARLTLTDGSPLPWKSHPGYPLHSFAFYNGTVFAGGDGSGGHVGAFDLATGAKLWTLQTDGGVQGVTVINGLLYVGGHFDNVCDGVFTGPTSGFNCPQTAAVRHKLLAIDPVTGALDPWAPGANSPLGVLTMANAGGTLVVGGTFTKIGKPDALGQATQNQQGYGQFSPVG